MRGPLNAPIAIDAKSNDACRIFHCECIADGHVTVQSFREGGLPRSRRISSESRGLDSWTTGSLIARAFSLRRQILLDNDVVNVGKGAMSCARGRIHLHFP